jgi:hypothetical protein
VALALALVSVLALEPPLGQQAGPLALALLAALVLAQLLLLLLLLEMVMVKVTGREMQRALVLEHAL